MKGLKKRLTQILHHSSFYETNPSWRNKTVWYQEYPTDRWLQAPRESDRHEWLPHIPAAVSHLFTGNVLGLLTGRTAVPLNTEEGSTVEESPHQKWGTEHGRFVRNEHPNHFPLCALLAGASHQRDSDLPHALWHSGFILNSNSLEDRDPTSRDKKTSEYTGNILLFPKCRNHLKDTRHWSKTTKSHHGGWGQGFQWAGVALRKANINTDDDDDDMCVRNKVSVYRSLTQSWHPRRKKEHSVLTRTHLNAKINGLNIHSLVLLQRNKRVCFFWSASVCSQGTITFSLLHSLSESRKGTRVRDEQTLQMQGLLKNRQGQPGEGHTQPTSRVWGCNGDQLSQKVYSKRTN